MPTDDEFLQFAELTHELKVTRRIPPRNCLRGLLGEYPVTSSLADFPLHINEYLLKTLIEHPTDTYTADSTALEAASQNVVCCWLRAQSSIEAALQTFHRSSAFKTANARFLGPVFELRLLGDIALCFVTYKYAPPVVAQSKRRKAIAPIKLLLRLFDAGVRPDAYETRTQLKRALTAFLDELDRPPRQYQRRQTSAEAPRNVAERFRATYHYLTGTNSPTITLRVLETVFPGQIFRERDIKKWFRAAHAAELAAALKKRGASKTAK